jgi:hypothetical protein
MKVFARLAAAVGALAAAAGFLKRRKAQTDTAQQDDLRALLDEVRSLRQDLDVLKANPAIGRAVDSTLDFAHDSTTYEKSAYAVAVRQTRDLDLEQLASYNVAVRPDLGRGEEPIEG